jgi:N,N-dimethylformamidase
VPRILDDDGHELIGYTDRWSAQAGQSIELMVSTTSASFAARVVRLRHGDPSPEGPGFLATPVASAIDGSYPGVVQLMRAGSHGIAESAPAVRTVALWVWPTRPCAGREQALLACGEAMLFLDADGRPGLRAAGAELTGPVPLARERWVQLAIVLGAGRIALAVEGRVVASSEEGAEPMAGTIQLACDGHEERHFDGRLEELTGFGRALEDDVLALEALAAEAPDWRCDIRSVRLVNAPMTAVTGHLWDDDTTDFRAAPAEYGAVHFHSDDLEDAGWEPALSLTIPESLASGIYAFELSADGLEDHVPFVVRPAPGQPRARAALLLPTLTYQVYGNERLIAGGDTGMAPAPVGDVSRDPADCWLDRHPEAGRSCYDYHADGHGVALVSLRRPIPNLRPSFRWWITDAPERFGADLYLVDWLDELGEPYDVITDHDLHDEGLALLADYRVVLTGTHPEYSSRAMLGAIEGYLNRGGRLMYLGGNGFYWVTSIDPDRPHLAEVRRGINGTRGWSSRPGELRHQTTGEQGGLWRYRGRDPNRLVGVGFASQSDCPDVAPGYRRTAASRDPAHAWIFDGVETDMIGEHGLYLGGAAGYEIDRFDRAFGSPPEAVVLATSQGLHPPSYLLVVEDMEVTIPAITGADSDRVRADIVHLPYPNGGAVFSVGSCSWCGSLSTSGYVNDVARITENVLRRFLER